LYQATVPVDTPKVRVVPVAVQTVALSVVNSPIVESALTVTFTASDVIEEQEPLVNTILYQVSSVKLPVVNVLIPFKADVAAITESTSSNPSVEEVVDFLPLDTSY